jgi:hypothetical protein
VGHPKKGGSPGKKITLKKVFEKFFTHFLLLFQVVVKIYFLSGEYTICFYTYHFCGEPILYARSLHVVSQCVGPACGEPPFLG